MPNNRDKSPARKKKDAMSNGWVFTMNNYTDEDVASLKIMARLAGNKIAYMCFGKEVGERGTKHLQGLLFFETRKRHSTINKLLEEYARKCFVEQIRGTPKQAADYCKKDGQFFEHGVLPEESGQGTRSDLILVKKLIDEGSSIPINNLMDEGSSVDDLGKMDEHFSTFLRYNRGLDRYQQAQTAERSFKSQVMVLTGSPGTFKSYAISRLKNRYHVVRPTGKQQPVWYDGYDGRVHSVVVYDDFYGWMPYASLLELCDRYACRVQSKGGTKQFRPAAVVFTSNREPRGWYKFDQPGLDYSAFERRVDIHAEHLRVDADAGGFKIGDILIRFHKGLPACHPLFRFMTLMGFDEDNKAEYRLDMPMLREELDTQMDNDTTIAFWEALREDAPEMVSALRDAERAAVASIAADQAALESEDESPNRDYELEDHEANEQYLFDRPDEIIEISDSDSEESSSDDIENC